MSDNHVNIYQRVSERQEKFQPPYDQWVFTHYAKSDEQYNDNYDKMLASNTTLVRMEQPVPGPLIIAHPTPINNMTLESPPSR